MKAKMPDITMIIDLMYSRAGMILTQNKSQLILTKLQPLLNKYNLNNVNELLGMGSSVIDEVIDTLTINETSFYRDIYPFELIHKYIIPYFQQNNPELNAIRILCAACATGQEPYSLAMQLLEHKEYKFDYKIIAVDLSNSAIEKAKMGNYTQFEIQRGLKPALLNKYFTKLDKDWFINEDVKAHIIFHQANLLKNLNSLGVFDIVFCRNLLIYLDSVNRKRVVDNLKKIMNHGSIIVIGSMESLLWDDDDFTEITNYNGIYVYK